jgi:hypothetical protein
VISFLAAATTFIPRSAPIDRTPEPISPALVWTLILTALVIATLALLVLQLIARDRRAHGPALRRICQSLRIGPQDYRLLLRMAKTLEDAHPGSLILSDGCFDAAAERFMRRHGRKGHVFKLRRLLFD